MTNIEPTREIVEGNLARMTGSSVEDMPHCLANAPKADNQITNGRPYVKIPFYFDYETGKIEYFGNEPKETKESASIPIPGIFHVLLSTKPTEKSTIIKKLYSIPLDSIPQARANLHESANRYNQLE